MSRAALRTLVAAAAAATLTLSTLGGLADTARAEPPSLEQAVADAMLSANAEEALVTYDVPDRAALDPLVEPKRRSSAGDWVFGGSVFPVPDSAHASPVTSLFFAELEGDAWSVALDGSPEFARAAREAPAELFVDEGERESLAARPKGVEVDGQATGLALPWQLNQGNWRHWGVHGNSGTSRPYNSIDFYGGDGRVRASEAGYVYRYCGTANPYIEVRHDSGWTTGYYHTRNQTTVPDGSKINAYDFIGIIAEELPCGGRANGDHVHWTLWRDGSAVAVNGKDIGGWTWYEQPAAYQGWAERGGNRVYNSGCCLANHGPEAGTRDPTTP
ncbi:MAG: M23 family metallopeptidase [Stackebrandtia sp.]